jgi:hypothetical protein
LLLSIILPACNPVKQVLKDKNKLDIVAIEVIRQGYCINDTVVETRVDTLYQSDSSAINSITLYKEIDTIFTDGTTLRIDSSGILSVGCPVKVQYKTVTKTETIRDKALENILKKDIAKLDSIKQDLEFTVRERNILIEETQQQLEKSERKFKLFLFALFAVVAAGAYLKVRKILPF